MHNVKAKQTVHAGMLVSPEAIPAVKEDA